MTETEEITRASASKRKTTSSTAKKKTSSTTAKKKTSSSTAKKKTSTAKKKTSSSTSLKLTAAEKKLVQDYRKCNALEKKIIALLTEKAAGGITRLDGMADLLNQ